MNRYMSQFRYSLENKMIDIYARVAIGASGAPTLNAPLSKGVTSITRNSAGLYTIVFNDRYVNLLNFNINIFLAAGTSSIGEVILRANNIATSTRSVQVQFNNSAGAAVDPANGVTLYCKFEFKGSSV